MVRKIDCPNFVLLEINDRMTKPFLVMASNNEDKLWNQMVESQISSPYSDFVIYERKKRKTKRWD